MSKRELNEEQAAALKTDGWAAIILMPLGCGNVVYALHEFGVLDISLQRAVSGTALLAAGLYAIVSSAVYITRHIQRKWL